MRTAGSAIARDANTAESRIAESIRVRILISGFGLLVVEGIRSEPASFGQSPSRSVLSNVWLLAGRWTIQAAVGGQPVRHETKSEGEEETETASGGVRSSRSTSRSQTGTCMDFEIDGPVGNLPFRPPWSRQKRAMRLMASAPWRNLRTTAWERCSRWR